MTNYRYPIKPGEYQKDWSGHRFGNLLCIEFSHKRKGRRYFKVRCDCGIEKTSQLDGLQDGRIKSCGPACPAKPRKSVKDQAIKSIHLTYKRHALAKNRVYELTEIDIEKLVTSACHYCGGTDSNSYRSTTMGSPGIFNYNGIDRVDSSLGYTLNNVVACCQHCNFMKQEMSLTEWFSRMEKVLNHVRKAWNVDA